MDNAIDERIRLFFSLSHRARQLLMGLLTAVFLGTVGQAVVRMAQPASQVAGTIVDLSENKINTRSAQPSLTVQDNQATHIIRLRNNGRIWKALQSREDLIGLRAVIEVQGGMAVKMVPADGSSQSAREAQFPPLVMLLIGLIPLLLLLFHTQPRLLGSPADPASRPAQSSPPPNQMLS